MLGCELVPCVAAPRRHHPCCPARPSAAGAAGRWQAYTSDNLNSRSEGEGGDNRFPEYCAFLWDAIHVQPWFGSIGGDEQGGDEQGGGQEQAGGARRMSFWPLRGSSDFTRSPYFGLFR
jgi:hypothetical protein